MLFQLALSYWINSTSATSNDTCLWFRSTLSHGSVALLKPMLDHCPGLSVNPSPHTTMPAAPKTIGFIGTGNMGRPMIAKLLQAHFTVKVYDLYKESAAPVLSAGAKWSNTPRECALETDIVCTNLPLPEHVRQNMLGPHGALSGMRPGAVWVDCSTTDFHITLQIADSAWEKGVYSVEAPVSNLSHMGVDFGNMSFFAAGHREGYELLKGFLETTGKIDFYVGQIGKAQSAKLLTNMMFYTSAVAFGEVSCVLRLMGVPMYWWWEQVRQSRGRSVASDQFSVFVWDGSWDDSCTLKIAEKDMGLAVDMAREVGERLGVGKATNESYMEASRRYSRYEGHMQVVRVTEEDNGIELRIEGFTAPSKYGKNKAYRHPDGIWSDEVGRIRPRLPEGYRAPAFEASEEQRKVMECGIRYLELVNEAIYSEAVQLGVKMGMERELVEKMVQWSVGTCWVSDHLQQFVAESKNLETFCSCVAKSGANLRHLSHVQQAIRKRHGWD